MAVELKVALENRHLNFKYNKTKLCSGPASWEHIVNV